MKKLLLALLLAVSCRATTLTGTMNAPDGTGVNGYLYLSLSQQAALVSTGGCGGPIEVVPTYRVRIQLVDGAMQGSPSVYGNDCMLPDGTYYLVEVRDANGNVLMSDRWVISGASIDIGTIVSVVISGTTQLLGAPGVVYTQPVAAQTVNQPGATNLNVNRLNVSSVFTAPNGATCDSTGCTGFVAAAANYLTTNTAQTITGVKTFAVDMISSGANIGSAIAPFQDGFFSRNFKALNGFFGTSLATQSMKIAKGDPSAPTDFFVFVNNQTNLLQVLDSGANIVWQYDATSFPNNFLTVNANIIPNTPNLDLGTGAVIWRDVYAKALIINGTRNSSINVGTDGNFWGRTFTGADANCTGIQNGWMGVRVDTAVLQVCLGEAMYQVQLVLP